MSLPIFVIVGCTCSGKTALAIALAKHCNGEIISADSRQLYRYMDIGTAKPSRDELQAVKHHFIDILNPDQEYNAGKFGKEARKVIDTIIAQNKTPIVVGGSGLYIEALIDGFFDGPSADPELRHYFYERLKKEGGDGLHKELQKVDPDAASKMLPSNTRRIIRALEVFRITGTPISQLQKSATPISLPYRLIALDWNRKTLYERINERTKRMIEQGLIDEVKRLQELGYSRDLNALQTVGYQEAFRFLAGEISYDDMVELIKRNTRRYAKRQMTWFRADKRIRWIPVDDSTNFETLAENILKD
ncbi:MAG: tRNA (adenosine(37)-N6)-dimethylallyltransferase MiaA [Bacteroidota bacterium]